MLCALEDARMVVHEEADEPPTKQRVLILEVASAWQCGKSTTEAQYGADVLGMVQTQRALLASTQTDTNEG